MRKKSSRKIAVLFLAITLVLGGFNSSGISSSLAESETDNTSPAIESPIAAAETPLAAAERPIADHQLTNAPESEIIHWKFPPVGSMKFSWTNKATPEGVTHGIDDTAYTYYFPGRHDHLPNWTFLVRNTPTGSWYNPATFYPSGYINYGDSSVTSTSVTKDIGPFEYTLSIVAQTGTLATVTMEATNTTDSTKYLKMTTNWNAETQIADWPNATDKVSSDQDITILPYNQGLSSRGTHSNGKAEVGTYEVLFSTVLPWNTPITSYKLKGSGNTYYPDDDPSEEILTRTETNMDFNYPEHKVEPGESVHETFTLKVTPSRDAVPGVEPPEVVSFTPDSTPGVPAEAGAIIDITSNVATGTPFGFSGTMKDVDSSEIKPLWLFNETLYNQEAAYIPNPIPGEEVAFEGEVPIPTTLEPGSYDFVINAQSSSLDTGFVQNGSKPFVLKLLNSPVPTINANNVTIQQNITPGYIYDPMTNPDVNLSATDAIDGSIPNSSIVVTSNTVNPAVPGDYQVTYSVTNANGKTGTKTATVTVAAVNFTVTEHFTPEGDIATTNPVTVNIGQDYMQTKANLEATKFPVLVYENIEYSLTGLDGSWVSMPATLAPPELADISANKDIYYRADKIKAVAKIGTTGYATLEEAILAANAATGPSKIEMLIDQYELTSPQPINKDITITTASKTDATLPYRGTNTQAEITLGTQLTTAPLFNVITGAKFTLGNIKIDGNGTTEAVGPSRIFATSGNALITNAGTVNLSGDVATSTEVDESAIVEDYKGTSSPIVNETGGTLNIEGKIQNNTGQDGGAVNAKGDSTVNIKGGSITGNIATGNGGGLNIASSAALNIDSGIVNNNHASTKGGGIYQQGDMSVKGKVEVKGNTSGATNVVENIYLVKTTADQSQLESANYIQVNGSVTAGSEIGVTTETTPLVDDKGKQYTIIAAPANDEELSTMSAYFKHDQQARNANAYSVLIDRRHGGENLILDSTSLVPFHFTKVDAADQTKPLAGATFKLYVCEEDHTTHTGEVVTDEIVTAGSCWVPYKDENGTEVEVTSNEDGIVEFETLPDNDYMLVETKSPTGYEKPTGQWLITTNSAELTPDGDTDYPVTVVAKGDRPPLAYIDGDANHETLDDFKFQNMKQQALPFSGGKGIYLFIVAGLVMMSGSALLLFKNRQKQNA